MIENTLKRSGKRRSKKRKRTALNVTHRPKVEKRIAQLVKEREEFRARSEALSAELQKSSGAAGPATAAAATAADTSNAATVLTGAAAIGTRTVPCVPGADRRGGKLRRPEISGLTSSRSND